MGRAFNSLAENSKQAVRPAVTVAKESWINTRCPSGVAINLLGIIFCLVDDVYLIRGTEKYLG
jgi:hypothetical protein